VPGVGAVDVMSKLEGWREAKTPPGGWEGMFANWDPLHRGGERCRLAAFTARVDDNGTVALQGGLTGPLRGFGATA